MICPKCKFKNRQEVQFCSACGAALYPTMRVESGKREKQYADGKNPFLATIVSFIFPAGGQLYNRDFKKAAIIGVAYIGCAFLFFTFAAAIPAILLSLLVWGFAIFDAYGVAKRQKAIW